MGIRLEGSRSPKVTIKKCQDCENGTPHHEEHFTLEDYTNEDSFRVVYNVTRYWCLYCPSYFDVKDLVDDGIPFVNVNK